MVPTPACPRRGLRPAPAAAAFFLALAVQVPAAAPASAQEAPPAAGPYAEDVASVDAIIHALYDVISGPVGEARDWDRFRALFIPGARLIPTGRSPSGDVTHGVLTVEEYISGGGESLVAMGFREREIARTTEAFGHIVHVFSTYEGIRGDEEEPFLRGINSIQLLNDGERWWIVTVLWSPESPDHPLPERYLGE